MQAEITLRQAAAAALEALEKGETKLRWAAISALKQALAEPEQEPVAWLADDGTLLSDVTNPKMYTPLYTAPTTRKPLTDEELEPLLDEVESYDSTNYDLVKFARAIERAHGIGEQHE